MTGGLTVDVDGRAGDEAGSMPMVDVPGASPERGLGGTTLAIVALC